MPVMSISYSLFGGVAVEIRWSCGGVVVVHSTPPHSIRVVGGWSTSAGPDGVIFNPPFFRGLCGVTPQRPGKRSPVGSASRRPKRSPDGHLRTSGGRTFNHGA